MVTMTDCLIPLYKDMEIQIHENVMYIFK